MFSFNSDTSRQHLNKERKYNCINEIELTYKISGNLIQFNQFSDNYPDSLIAFLDIP